MLVLQTPPLPIPRLLTILSHLPAIMRIGPTPDRVFQTERNRGGVSIPGITSDQQLMRSFRGTLRVGDSRSVHRISRHDDRARQRFQSPLLEFRIGFRLYTPGWQSRIPGKS